MCKFKGFFLRKLVFTQKLVLYFACSIFRAKLKSFIQSGGRFNSIHVKIILLRFTRSFTVFLFPKGTPWFENGGPGMVLAFLLKMERVSPSGNIAIKRSIQTQQGVATRHVPTLPKLNFNHCQLQTPLHLRIFWFSQASATFPRKKRSRTTANTFHVTVWALDTVHTVWVNFPHLVYMQLCD